MRHCSIRNSVFDGCTENQMFEVVVEEHCTVLVTWLRKTRSQIWKDGSATSTSTCRNNEFYGHVDFRSLNIKFRAQLHLLNWSWMREAGAPLPDSGFWTFGPNQVLPEKRQRLLICLYKNTPRKLPTSRSENVLWLLAIDTNSKQPF